MTRHVSIDLESLGKNPQATIVAIAAVDFDPATGIVSTDSAFHRIIDLQAPGGGVMDVSTVLWWFAQSEEARRRLFVEPDQSITVPLMQALAEFSEWLGHDDYLPEGEEYPDVMLWQRGDKDSQWLTSAYEGTGLKPPYGYWQVSDQRTLCKYVPYDTVDRADNLAHDALGDAVHQAKGLCLAFAALQSLAAGS